MSAATAKPQIIVPDDETMYSLMKDLDDFDCFPIPETWYKRFGIKPREAVGPREFIESGYTLKCAYGPKDLPPVIVDKPQRDGYTWPLIEEEPIPVEIVERCIDQAGPSASGAPQECLTDAQPQEQVQEQEQTLTTQQLTS